MKHLSKELKIAFIAILAVILLFLGMQFLKGLSLFSSQNTYYVIFDNLNGVVSATPIYSNGYKVGVVKSIKYDYKSQKAVATIGMDKQYCMLRGTVAEIESDLLSNVSVSLTPSDNTNNQLLFEGDTIMGRQKTGIMSKATDMIPAIELMLPTLDSILTGINSLLQDPSLRESLHNIEHLTADLSLASGHLHNITNELDGRLPAITTQVDSILYNARVVTDNLANVNISSIIDNTNATLDNLKQTTSALNSRDGTLGLLLRDPKLYLNLTSTMNSADSLLKDLKNRPSRYVHFSLFGKKDH